MIFFLLTIALFIHEGTTGARVLNFGDFEESRLTNADRVGLGVLAMIFLLYVIYEFFRYFKYERYRGVYYVDSEGITLEFPSGRRMYGKWTELKHFHYWRNQLEFQGGIRIPIAYFGTAGFDHDEMDKLCELSGGEDSPISRTRRHYFELLYKADILRFLRKR